MKRTKSTNYSFCHSSFVYNNIQNYKSKALVIDTRDTLSYNNEYIQNSINLNKDRVQSHLQIDFDSKDLSQVTMDELIEVLNEEEFPKFAERKRKFVMLIVSGDAFLSDFIQQCKDILQVEDTSEGFEINENIFDDTLRAQFDRIKHEDSVSFGLQLFQLLQKDKVRELHILVDGAADFFSRYPFMNMRLSLALSHVADDCDIENRIDALHDLPHDILGGKLFLGSFNHARQYGVLKSLKISHVINAAHECHNVHESKGIKYFKIWVRDETSDSLSEHFQKAYDFISEVTLQQEGGVLVHCALGKSRSATLVIMYIMKKFNWDLQKALDYVKSRRAIISPFDGFVNELKELEKRQLEF